MTLASYIPTSSMCHTVIAYTCIVWVFKTMCVGTCTTSLCFLIKNVYPEKVVDLGSCKKQCRFWCGPGTLSEQHLVAVQDMLKHVVASHLAPLVSLLACF